MIAFNFHEYTLNQKVRMIYVLLAFVVHVIHKEWWMIYKRFFIIA